MCQKCTPFVSNLYCYESIQKKNFLENIFIPFFKSSLSCLDLLTDGAARIILFSTFFPCHLMPWSGFEPTSVSRVAWARDLWRTLLTELPRHGFFVENISLLKYLSGILVGLVGVSVAGLVSDHGHLKCWIEQLWYQRYRLLIILSMTTPNMIGNRVKNSSSWDFLAIKYICIYIKHQKLSRL